MREIIWLGRAVCVLDGSNEQYLNGYNGAIFNFACKANNIIHCTELIFKEAQENNLVIIGFEFLSAVENMERIPSEYEQELILSTELYPVQFRNVHFFKMDS